MTRTLTVVTLIGLGAFALAMATKAIPAWIGAAVAAYGIGRLHNA